MANVLMIMSAADHWTLKDGSEHPTGFWAEEFVAPYEVFTDAGWSVTVATPGGRAPTVDQASLGEGAGDPETLDKVKASLDRLAPVLNSPADLASVDHNEFDVVFYPGGHGPLQDLAVDKTSGAILAERVTAEKPLAMLCHAPAAVLAASEDASSSPFAGYKMTGFSNVEEEQVGLAEGAPWLLEDKLVELGADYSSAAEPWASHVVVDRNLYTGQNPQSSEELAKRIVSDLG
ncbi:type 1 glutamine amidotransferase domain-containing protein [Dietzia maris]|jgi:putative intracellular protease/amidase|uniref:Type 1 glutamine amidotransferase domain-containing protein n=1 Tax=Dietzia maris TaxID=37915 RepID=A0A365P7M1_9ACTN|nr:MULTISPECIES: type 1 glutamine amidotransferase domain-containing protein [Dietzia]MBB0991265.1 type 1 glutamine amidotransferase domain-containing protein [Dietzia sp. SLG510A3-30A2]MBB0995409.1 type 1 glutamine amidotransferase domain-containing protein [Dietzia sp. SLG510A3-40A3]MBB1008264.1 type 1 glutamine amidotransferase domain-containing protein [Dietzia sp. SLG510A3-3B2-2]MBB1018699.1 type 1 glutamine amidotransferase domain-containing protein [Dietzia sp. DQ11-71]MCT1432831.1 type